MHFGLYNCTVTVSCILHETQVEFYQISHNDSLYRNGFMIYKFHNIKDSYLKHFLYGLHLTDTKKDSLHNVICLLFSSFVSNRIYDAIHCNVSNAN